MLLRTGLKPLFYDDRHDQVVGMTALVFYSSVGEPCLARDTAAPEATSQKLEGTQPVPPRTSCSGLRPSTGLHVIEEWRHLSSAGYSYPTARREY